MSTARANETRPEFCVLGAGNGGLALASYLGLLGHPVVLWNRSPARLEPVIARGTILLSSQRRGDPHQGEAPVRLATTDIASALADADVVMVVVPANAHASIAERVAPHLRDGQMVVLNPGRTGGALEFSHILEQQQMRARVIVAEAQTFLFASRTVSPGEARIYRVKNSIAVAALPAWRTPEVVRALRSALPQFVPGDNVMKTSLSNIGAVFHAPATVLNAGRIEQSGLDFEYYLEGVSRSVARVLERVDAERVALSHALGLRAMTAREWLYVAYDAVGRDLYEAIRATTAYGGIAAPPTLAHRYLDEEVPTSLVPMVAFGELLDVETPTIRHIVSLACALRDRDYWAEGRTAERLGIQGLSARELNRLVLGLDPEHQPPPTDAR